MNFLVLLDLAPNYHKFLVETGKALNRRGHKTFYAIDSPLNNWRYPEHPPEGEARIFSEFLAGFEESDEVPTFPWRAFFPDFDRYENYGVNYGNKQGWYLRLGAALEAFFESCVRDWKIDAIVYEGVTNSYAFFANRVAKRLGIRYVGIQASRIPGRHELHGESEDVLRQRLKNHYEMLEEGGQADAETEELVTIYMNGFVASTPDYMTKNGLLLENPLSRYAKIKNLSTFARLLQYQMTRKGVAHTNYRSGPPLSYSYHNAKRNAFRWLRSHFLRKYFQNPVVGDSYYLYPIHFHPEASTSVNSRWYVDEYPVIKNLAFSLPPGCWLYVKDHPSAVGYPSLDFYRKVSKLPNVRLIPPGGNTKQLIKNSKGLITQTSTAGYEALVLHKPVWVLGEVFYDFHPGCLKVGWNQALEDSFLPPPQAGATDRQARNLVTAYFLSTKPGMLPVWGESAENVSFKELAAEIEQQVHNPE